MKIVYFLFSVMVISILSGCSGNATDEKAFEMPKEIPEQFDFHVKYGVEGKNEINTYKGEVVKDLIADGSISTKDIKFTPEEIKKIYKSFRDSKVFGPLYLAKENSCHQTPYEEFYIRVSVGNSKVIHETEHKFSEENCGLTGDGEKLKSVIVQIRSIVEEKEAYKALPDAAGGYD